MQIAPSNGTAQHPPDATTAPSQHPPALTLQDAASRLGVSLNTLRRKIAAGEVQADRVERPQGYAWRVYLDPAQHPPVAPSSVLQPPDSTLQQDPAGVQPTDAALVEALALVERQQTTILELSGRVGYLQAELAQARAQLALAEPQADQGDQHQLAPLRRRWWHLW